MKAADVLGAPIVKALLGKAAVPDDSPFTTGQIGLLGTRPSQEAMEHCDTLLMVGTSFPYIEFLPKPGQGPVVIEAVVDPFVPPMPPKITVAQAAKFGEALLKGTPHRDKIALTVPSDNVKEMI